MHQPNLSIRPLIVAMVVTIACWSFPTATGAATPTATAMVFDIGTTSLHVVGASPTEVATIVEAAERFEALGLTLPDLEVTVDADPQACRGHEGYWTPGHQRDRIDLCVVGEFLVLHEMAHAWEHHNVDDPTRRAFMARYPDDQWRQDGLHRNQGIERFADAVAWGLLAAPIDIGQIDEAIRLDAIAQRAEAFERATGQRSPRLQHQPHEQQMTTR